MRKLVLVTLLLGAVWMCNVVLADNAVAAPASEGSTAGSSAGKRPRTTRVCWWRMSWTTCRIPRYDGWGRTRGYKTWMCQVPTRVCVSVPVQR